MADRFITEHFMCTDDAVKELNVYKDKDRWYARVVLERTLADGTVQRFTLPRVMIPPVYGIISAHADSDNYFDDQYYYKLVLKNNAFVLTEGYDADINRYVAFYVREQKHITRKEAEKMLSANGTTYTIVDDEEDDDDD